MTTSTTMTKKKINMTTTRMNLVTTTAMLTITKTTNKLQLQRKP